MRWRIFRKGRAVAAESRVRSIFADGRVSGIRSARATGKHVNWKEGWVAKLALRASVSWLEKRFVLFHERKTDAVFCVNPKYS